MKQILVVLSVVAVVASLQVIGGDKKGACSSCPSAKTAVGATAATEGSACAASKTEVGSEAKSECASGSCEKGKTAVGETAASEGAACDASKAKVGTEAKSDCGSCEKGKTAVGEQAKSDCSSCESSKTAVGEKAKAECSQKTLTFKVGGAACEESCGNLVKTLTSIKGISTAESCSKSSMTKISYDPATVKSEQIAAAIVKAGYKIEGQQVSLPVEGMACEACSTKVGKTLTSLEGVISGSACHESKKATVLYDPAKVKEQQIVAAINGAGFKASAQ
jgi:copper ion binding protein